MVVHVPMTSSYRRRVNDTDLWTSYAAWLVDDLNKRGDAYLDLSASVDDALFDDGVHINREGSRVFSQALGEATGALLHDAWSF